MVILKVYWCRGCCLISGGLWSTLLDEPGIYGAVGCHPKCATDFNQKTYTAMGHMIRDPRVVAVGEIGLDYSGVFVPLFT